jgi:glutamine synthetase
MSSKSEIHIDSTTEEVLSFLQRYRDAKWLRVYWLDYASSSKCRLIPMRQILQNLEKGSSIALSITECCLGLLPNDTTVPGVTPVGAYNLHPDWSSLRWGPVNGHVSCYGEFRLQDGSECILCPRTVLRKTLEKASSRDLSFLVGFEIEFIALEPNSDSASPQKYRTIRSDGHSWSTSRVLADWGREGSFSSALEEMVDYLNEATIKIEMLHAEAAPGQYEIVLPPSSPLQACDTLLHARQIIESTAARHGFRATLHPKPWAAAVGSASHAHVSISSAGGDAPTLYGHFYAGILKHLRAIVAFTCANPVSYDRIVDGYWAGGRWVAWGTQNRETPLRKIEAGHWEFKALDGLANPYFAISAILAAGIDGIVRETSLAWEDCKVDPATLTATQRNKLGITELLPASLEEALSALSSDKQFTQLFHPDFVQRYIDTKNGEIAILASKTPEEARQWILERL